MSPTATVYRLLILTITLIVYGTLYPWHFDFADPPRHPLLVLLTSQQLVWERFALRDIAVNLMLYLPFGATAMWSFGRRFPRAVEAATVTLAAMALSGSLEMLQVYVPGRVCSLSDLVCTTIGAGVGVVLALIYPHTGKRKRAAIPASGMMLLVLFAGYQMYPFFPVLSHTKLVHTLEWLYRAQGFSLNEGWSGAAEWFAALVVLKLVLDAYGSRAVRLVPVLAVLCLPLRMIIATRTLALHEVLGALLGWFSWTLVRPRLRQWAAVWLLASAIILSELSPFQFAAHPSAFVWIPFGATFDFERQSALVIWTRKAFDYGAMVWLLRTSGRSWPRAGATVATALTVLEVAQRWLPGQTPETTDAVLTLLLTTILWTFERFQGRRQLA